MYAINNPELAMLANDGHVQKAYTSWVHMLIWIRVVFWLTFVSFEEAIILEL